MNALIVGGGIAGLATAHTLARYAPQRFKQLALWERAPRFEEVGAGVQIGPNASRLLIEWGLGAALERVACKPQSLAICGTDHNRLTAERRLGAQTVAQYGAPSYTIHRADLHQMLLDGVQALALVDLHRGRAFQNVRGLAPNERLQVRYGVNGGDSHEQALDALFVCDGGFSPVRAQVLRDGPPLPTGQVAYRALLPIDAVSNPALRTRVTAWMGPKMHAVAYPVRAGTLFNIVVIVQTGSAVLQQGWEGRPVVPSLDLPDVVHNRDLAALIEVVSEWRYWVLCDRVPLERAQTLAPHPRIALLGDAAHPMLPFLAQGAAMAIEDAHVLAQCLAQANSVEWGAALRAFAQQRWQRNSRVQAGARRNARIFHASGPVAWARDAALGVAGSRLLDMPWLYGGQPASQN